MRECVRHAFTDGTCVQHGCKDCPETLYAKELAAVSKRSKASLAAFILPIALAALGFLAIVASAYAAPGNLRAYEIARERV